MKNLINSVLLVVLLTGCSTVQKYWPRPHDPALAQAFISTKLVVDNLDCADKSDWSLAEYQVHWLNEYAMFRDDPQKDNTKGLEEGLQKAKDASPKACEIWLNLAKQRLVVLNKAWSGR